MTVNTIYLIDDKLKIAKLGLIVSSVNAFNQSMVWYNIDQGCWMHDALPCTDDE